MIEKTVTEYVEVERTYKRDNQTVQTDTGKYNYSLDPTSGAVTLKEKSLTR